LLTIKTAEIMRVLRVSRPTVYNYRVQGNLTGKVMTNGSWNDDKEAVYKLLNDDVSRKNFFHARVSTPKQKVDLENN
jgi:putative resolvase